MKPTSSLLTSPLPAALVVALAIVLGLLVSSALAVILGGVATIVVVVVGQASATRSAVERYSGIHEAQLTHVWPWPELLDLVDEGLLILDGRRTILFANQQMAALLGHSQQEIAGQPLIRAAWSSELTRLVAEVDGVSREIALEGGRTVLATASHPASPGDPSHVLVMLREVSDSRRAERSRTELVANLSHELRTPIAAARALAETIEGGVEDDERRARYQRQLITEIDRLAVIVERTLRLSRIEAGVESLDLAPVAPDQLLAAAVQRLVPLAEARGVSLHIAPTPGIPQVVADFDRGVEVLTMLLDNAIKFSPPGDVVVVGSSLGAGFVTFEVRDRGPGVLPAERERIFERLYTGDPSRAWHGDQPSGFGLGLAIARHLVARMGGRIWVADLDGAGAAFHFTLPVSPDDGMTR
ncbi:MAG: PAS domain-containing protein [Dehalococcoidia bacterium]|nr:PAS domain-containing protein [Dehalococcoidia bacterium]